MPTLEFNLIQITLQMVMVPPSKIKLSGQIVTSCSYFNPYPLRWEPIIEKVGFIFDVVSAENPKSKIALSLTEESESFNVNVSEEMVFN